MTETPSEKLIAVVESELDKAMVSGTLRNAVETLIVQYRSYVKAALRLESTIHNMTKDR